MLKVMLQDTIRNDDFWRATQGCNINCCDIDSSSCSLAATLCSAINLSLIL